MQRLGFYNSLKMLLSLSVLLMVTSLCVAVNTFNAAYYEKHISTSGNPIEERRPFSFQCMGRCGRNISCSGVNVLYPSRVCVDLSPGETESISEWEHVLYRKTYPPAPTCQNGGVWEDSTKTSCKECDVGFAGTFCERHWEDCSEGFDLGITISGVYTIQPRLSPSPFDVYCEATWGGRTFIQLQKDGLNFTQGWQEYRDGFGSPSGDHWLGLQRIYEICISKSCRLQFHLTLPCCPNWKQCYYYGFRLTDENDGYRFQYSRWSIGNTQPQNQLPDALAEMYGVKFSTMDRDNDESPGHCAQTHRAGWWFKNCTLCNPNGQLNPIPNRVGEPWQVFWETGDDRGIKKINMALRTYN